MIKKLLPYAKPQRLFAFLAPLFVVIEVLLEVMIPYIMALLVDVGIKNQDIDYVLKAGGVMVLLAMFALFFGAMSARFAAKASVGFAANLRQGLFDKIIDFSFRNRDKFSTPSLVTRLTTDITNIQNAYMMILRMLFRAPVMLITSLIMAFRINSSLFTVFLVAVPILGISFFLVIMLAFPRFQVMLQKYDLMNASVQENLTSIRVVKAFVRGTFENLKFKKSSRELKEASIHAEKLVILETPVMQLTIYLTIVALLWFGGNLVINGSLLSGQLFSFITYVNQIFVSLMMIAMVFINLVLSKASAARAVEIIDEVIDIQDPTVKEGYQISEGTIEFRDVSFRYSETSPEPVLQHINLKIKAGEKIGIIGGTGSAKTTLVQLIPRLYDVSNGAVLVDGHDVKDYPLDILRREVGMVLQKNVLFSGTIQENLKWGNQAASEEQIIEAAKAAQAHDFIKSFPNDYETNLGQGGVNVSGGQKQRLSIARALLKHPKILILDDSTSAVDTATDAKIQEALTKSLQDTTTIIIAQRISSVEHLDRIIIMDNGRIHDVGTHDELLKNNYIYQEIYQSQQKGGEK